MNQEDTLLIENQLCFSLYRLSKFITANYKQYLDELNLTYPQYLVMLVLWEEDSISLKELGAKLSLDSGTLTPLIRRLIDKRLVKKKRSKDDERVVYIITTTRGKKLKEPAQKVPTQMLCSAKLDVEKLGKIKNQIDEIYNQWSKNE